MTNILNITNGDSAVDIMKKAGVEGDFLPWRDLLHEGAVPVGLSMEAFSKVRMEYLASHKYGSLEAIEQSFVERDDVMAHLDKYDKVVLWFEHDLYDQLQLLQILDFLKQNPCSCELTIICTDNYLGLCTPDEMSALREYEVEVTDALLSLGSECWDAFTSVNPLAWQALLDKDTALLPFLEGAIVRLLEEYPSQKNGLSRTEQVALAIIAKGEECRPGRIFGLYSKTEERKFLGDSSFWHILTQMLESNPPLLTINMPLLPINSEQCIEITDMGREVLAGQKSWLELSLIDKWIGGVHLISDDVWMWDGKKMVQ